MRDELSRKLLALHDVDIVLAALPAGVLGCTDGRTIWLERSQKRGQLRSTLMHELEHLADGHDSCQPPIVERRVEERAARNLISLDALLDALLWTQDERELCEELWVDRAMLRTRLSNLADDELSLLRSVLDLREDCA